MQVKLKLLLPEIISTLDNKELQIRFRVFGKSAIAK